MREKSTEEREGGRGGVDGKGGKGKGRMEKGELIK